MISPKNHEVRAYADLALARYKRLAYDGTAAENLEEKIRKHPKKVPFFAF